MQQQRNLHVTSLIVCLAVALLATCVNANSVTGTFQQCHLRCDQEASGSAAPSAAPPVAGRALRGKSGQRGEKGEPGQPGLMLDGRVAALEKLVEDLQVKSSVVGEISMLVLLVDVQEL